MQVNRKDKQAITFIQVQKVVGYYLMMHFKQTIGKSFAKLHNY
ncbi:hypothetical protein L21SP5_01361 [Salinivirga cyanobacteriivorans]|uniref:Uncharacterized protein n=1 Tax=Salinivirga cyanobacteriivorans TaxID=1307839 RepID=A0A0S2HY47_9BACT|nr:hypothetical protein L21SP5_01361 [Salinivirga cyanobacteriivorans]